MKQATAEEVIIDDQMEEDEDFYTLDANPRVTVYQLPVEDKLCSHEVGHSSAHSPFTLCT